MSTADPRGLWRCLIHVVVFSSLGHLRGRHARAHQLTLFSLASPSATGGTLRDAIHGELLAAHDHALECTRGDDGQHARATGAVHTTPALFHDRGVALTDREFADDGGHVDGVEAVALAGGASAPAQVFAPDETDAEGVASEKASSYECREPDNNQDADQCVASDKANAVKRDTSDGSPPIGSFCGMEGVATASDEAGSGPNAPCCRRPVAPLLRRRHDQ